MKNLIPIVTILLLSLQATAQDPIQIQKNTLDHQMTEVFEKSNSYQEYKVIKKTELATLRRNILDSVGALEKQIASQKGEVIAQKNEIDSLRKELQDTKEALALSKEKEDGIYLLGSLTSKATYNGIMWTIIVILLLVSGFLFYRFMNSHKITKGTQLKLAEMEIELEDYRRNSLEREQKLRRKLQDEINKNRKI